MVSLPFQMAKILQAYPAINVIELTFFKIFQKNIPILKPMLYVSNLNFQVDYRTQALSFLEFIPDFSTQNKLVKNKNLELFLLKCTKSFSLL